MQNYVDGFFASNEFSVVHWRIEVYDKHIIYSIDSIR